MDYKGLVEKLKEMLPEKIPYGELVGAPWPYTNQGEMVYPDFEDYIIEQAATAIIDLLARAEAAEAEIGRLRNEHLKIQYGGEELTVQEICKRLERAETRAEKKIKQLTPCDRCTYDPPSSGDGKPCSFCPASKKED